MPGTSALTTHPSKQLKPLKWCTSELESTSLTPPWAVLQDWRAKNSSFYLGTAQLCLLTLSLAEYRHKSCSRGLLFGRWPLARAARREPTTGLTVGPGTLGGGLRAGNMRQSPDGPQRGEESAGEPQSAGNRARTPVRGDEPLVPVVPAVRGSSAQVTCRSPWPRKCRGKRMLMLD